MGVNVKFVKKIVFIAGCALAVTSCAVSDIQSIAANGSASNTTGKSFKATSVNKVTLRYGETSARPNQEIIGHVQADNYNLIGVPHSQANIEQELKKQAASIGGRSVINIQHGMVKTSGDVVK